MGIAGVCPECGTGRPLAEFLGDARERQALAAALKLDPRLADPLVAYLDLFAPPGKKVQTRKLVRVLTEIQELIASAEITRQRVTYPAPLDYWRQGIEETVARRDALTLPLGGHGYLESVVWSIASKAAAGAERRQEQDNAYRYGRQSTGGPTAVGDVMNKEKKRSGPPPGWKDRALGKRRGGNTDA